MDMNGFYVAARLNGLMSVDKLLKINKISNRTN